jgi:hypothetical protein
MFAKSTSVNTAPKALDTAVLSVVPGTVKRTSVSVLPRARTGASARAGQQGQQQRLLHVQAILRLIEDDR